MQFCAFALLQFYVMGHRFYDLDVSECCELNGLGHVLGRRNTACLLDSPAD